MKDASEQLEQLREVIRATYPEGEEAVIALVEGLVKAQAEAIVQLESRIEVLENQGRKDSQMKWTPKNRQVAKL